MSNGLSSWTGKLVRVRAIEQRDWETFHAFDQDSEAQRAGWQIQLPRSEEGSRRWAEGQSTRVPEGDSIQLAIETLDGQLVGSLNVHGTDRKNGTFEYGVGLGRQFWGKGYASEALRIVLRHYFDELRYQKVNATVYAFNEPSLALHRKLGFVEEGRIRRNYYTDGEYHDEVLFGMTAEEFRAGDAADEG